MTLLFLDKYLQLIACKDCMRPRASNRKFCETHLKLYRERFQLWSQERRACGKCISCQRSSFPGQLRCKNHRRINADRCRTWSADMRAQNRATGKCYKHGDPIIPNTAWCLKCRAERLPFQRAYRERQRLLKVGSAATFGA